MKSILALLLCVAFCLTGFAALAEDEALEMVYFPTGGFRFWYPAALGAQSTSGADTATDVMMYAVGSKGEICVMRYAGEGFTLEALSASLRADETCQNVTLDDSRSLAYLAYESAEGTVNTVVAGDDGYLYEILIGGNRDFALTAAQLVQSTLAPA